jgi:hypothetical protein
VGELAQELGTAKSTIIELQGLIVVLRGEKAALELKESSRNDLSEEDAVAAKTESAALRVRMAVLEDMCCSSEMLISDLQAQLLTMRALVDRRTGEENEDASIERDDASYEDLRNMYEMECSKTVELQADLVTMNNTLKKYKDDVAARDDALVILRAQVMNAGDPDGAVLPESLVDGDGSDPSLVSQSHDSSGKSSEMAPSDLYLRSMIEKKNALIKALRRDLARLLRRIGSLQTAHELFNCHVRSDMFAKHALEVASAAQSAARAPRFLDDSGENHSQHSPAARSSTGSQSDVALAPGGNRRKKRRTEP